jgi:transposase
LLGRLNSTNAELSQAIEQEVEKCPEAPRLTTHPGIGVLTALVFGPATLCFSAHIVLGVGLGRR